MRSLWLLAAAIGAAVLIFTQARLVRVVVIDVAFLGLSVLLLLRPFSRTEPHSLVIHAYTRVLGVPRACADAPRGQRARPGVVRVPPVLQSTEPSARGVASRRDRRPSVLHSPSPIWVQQARDRSRSPVASACVGGGPTDHAMPRPLPPSARSHNCHWAGS